MISAAHYKAAAYCFIATSIILAPFTILIMLTCCSEILRSGEIKSEFRSGGRTYVVFEHKGLTTHEDILELTGRNSFRPIKWGCWILPPGNQAYRAIRDRENGAILDRIERGAHGG